MTAQILMAALSLFLASQPGMMVEDFESLENWTTRGKEISVALDSVHVRSGRHSLHLRMAVDLKNGDTKYPMGWPAATKTYKHPIDLSGYDFIEFDAYFESSLGRDPDFAMHVTLRDDEGNTFYRTTLTDLRHGKWTHERFCIDGLDNARLGELQLWFSEATYEDGEIVNVYVDNLRATKAPPRPKLPDFRLGPTRATLWAGPKFIVWLAEPTEKVLRSTPAPIHSLRPERTIRLSGARGEYVSLQIVVRPQTETGGPVALKFSDFRAPGGAIIPASEVWWSPVEYVPAREGPPEGLPDPLPGPKPFTADRKWNYPIWIDIHIPPNARPGRYFGVGTVTLGDTAATVPIDLRVWNFSIPKRQSVGFVTHIYGPYGWGDEIKKWFGDMDWDEYVDKWRPKIVALLARYRMSPLTLESIEMKWNEAAAKVEISRPDRFLTRVQQYLDLGCGMYCMGVPYFFNRPSFLGAKKGTPEYFQRITAAYHAASAFIRANELPCHWLVYAADEVVVHKHTHPIDFALLNRVYDAIHAADPAIKIFATEVPSPLIHTKCDICWCMNVSSFSENVLRWEKAKGREVWWYNGYRPPRVQANIAASGIAHRATFWIMHKYGIDGYFIWTVNRWVSDPRKQPNRDKRTPAGNHFWLYPNPDGTVDVSLRMAMFRDGAEDYEYLAALERLMHDLAQAGHKQAAVRCRKALDQAESIILALDNTRCISYDELRRARYLVARTIDAESRF